MKGNINAMRMSQESKATLVGETWEESSEEMPDFNQEIVHSCMEVFSLPESTSGRRSFQIELSDR